MRFYSTFNRYLDLNQNYMNPLQRKIRYDKIKHIDMLRALSDLMFSILVDDLTNDKPK